MALTALNSSGQGTGTLALRQDTAHPLLVDHVPLTLIATAATTVADVVARFGKDLERASDSAGFATDLALRDPAIDHSERTEVGLSFTADAVPGAALTLAVTDEGCSVIYDPARIGEAALALLVARFEAALAQIGTAQTCADLWALPASERDQLLLGWNATGRSYDRTTIHAAFEAQVALAPDAEALVFEGEALSYGDLNGRANKLAHVLRDIGAAPGTPIGLYAARGVDLIVGALAILKSGGAYVPLDPAYPADRIAHYITDSAAPIIVTQSALAGQLPAHNAQVVQLDSDARIAAASAADPASAATAQDLAYLIYTSGSTGTPKGVMVNHGNVANFFAGMDDRIDHEAGAVWLAVTSLSFDISVLELFWTLSRGFKLVLAGDESRTQVSDGPIGLSDRKIDFNLFYWGNDGGVGTQEIRIAAGGGKVCRCPWLQRDLDARAAFPRLWRPLPEPLCHRRGGSGCHPEPRNPRGVLRGPLAPSGPHCRGMGGDRQPDQWPRGHWCGQRLAAR